MAELAIIAVDRDASAARPISVKHHRLPPWCQSPPDRRARAPGSLAHLARIKADGCGGGGGGSGLLPARCDGEPNSLSAMSRAAFSFWRAVAFTTTEV